MRKKLGWILASLLVCGMVLSACQRSEPQPEETKLKVDVGMLELRVGDSYSLNVTTNAGKEEVNFLSDRSGIASVNETGIITAVAPGEASITVSVREKSGTVEVKVLQKLSEGIVNGQNVGYEFTVPANGLYDIAVNLRTGEADLAALDGAVCYAFDGGYTTRLKSKKLADGKIVLGTKYLERGEHELLVQNAADFLEDTYISIKSAKVYGEDRMRLSTRWMDELYMETGANTDLPNYLGYVETLGWDDIWTHCQYLPATMYVASEFESAEYARRVERIADGLLLGKMQRENGAVYTVYRADDDVFQVSIEPDMPTGKYELWRGNAAFAEEMMNCYLYSGDTGYLNAAKKAMDFVIEHWTKTQVNGIFGNFYTKYTDSTGGAIDIMSTGRAVMVFSQLYELTKDTKYLAAAETQAKILLKAQETPYPEVEGLFASAVDRSGNLNEFRHGNAFANAMLGLAWVYRQTGKEVYLTAIDKGVKILDKVYDDELGMIIVMDGKLLPTNPGSGPAYMAGRIGQAVMTCAAFTGNAGYYRQGERVLEYAMGRNFGDDDLQNGENGWYYYLVGYEGMSNVETSFEIYLAQIQYYYLSEIWGIL